MIINQKKKNKLNGNKRDQELRVYSPCQWKKKNNQDNRKKEDKRRKKKELILIK